MEVPSLVIFDDPDLVVLCHALRDGPVHSTLRLDFASVEQFDKWADNMIIWIDSVHIDTVFKNWRADFERWMKEDPFRQQAATGLSWGFNRALE